MHIWGSVWVKIHVEGTHCDIYYHIMIYNIYHVIYNEYHEL